MEIKRAFVSLLPLLLMAAPTTVESSREPAFRQTWQERVDVVDLVAEISVRTVELDDFSVRPVVEAIVKTPLKGCAPNEIIYFRPWSGSGPIVVGGSYFVLLKDSGLTILDYLVAPGLPCNRFDEPYAMYEPDNPGFLPVVSDKKVFGCPIVYVGSQLDDGLPVMLLADETRWAVRDDFLLLLEACTARP